MSNPFARIANAAANAPVSLHWEAVKAFQEKAPSLAPLCETWEGYAIPPVSVKAVITPDEPLTVWMHRGYEGHNDFTYLVTDGQVRKCGKAFHHRIIEGGTFVLEIIEVMKQVHRVEIRLRPGFDPEKITSLLRKVDSIRKELRSVSKPASDEERTIEMVIRVVD